MVKYVEINYELKYNVKNLLNERFYHENDMVHFFECPISIVYWVIMLYVFEARSIYS